MKLPQRRELPTEQDPCFRIWAPLLGLRSLGTLRYGGGRRVTLWRVPRLSAQLALYARPRFDGRSTPSVERQAP